MELTIQYLQDLIEDINKNTIGIPAGEVPFNEFLYRARNTDIYACEGNIKNFPIFDFKHKIIRTIDIKQDDLTFCYLIKFTSNRGLDYIFCVVVIYNIGISILDQVYMKEYFPILTDESINEEIVEYLIDNIKNMFIEIKEV